MSRIRFLYVLVFVVGTGSLGAEIAVARLMAPFFGASTIVWANTIGVVLVALSLGYWLGGRLADRSPSLAGPLQDGPAGGGPAGGRPVRRPARSSTSPSTRSTRSRPERSSARCSAVLALIAIPVLLLGAASPYALRLAVPDVEHAGRIAGRLYAISTAGSLVGTMLSSLLLIPVVGTQRTFLVFALAIGAHRDRRPRPPLRARRGAARRSRSRSRSGTVRASDDGEVIYETETETQYAQVVEEPDGDRILQLNEGQAIHSLYKPGSYLTGRYWDGLIVLPFAALGHAARAGCDPRQRGRDARPGCTATTSRTPASTGSRSTAS